MTARKILSSEERRDLRRIGHALNVVVQIGDAGLSEGVVGEVDRALADHELIKVRLPAGDREARTAMIAGLCEATGASLVQAIGRVALIHRAAEEPDPRKSNVLRHRLG
jgi:RNA-binding protein